MNVQNLTHDGPTKLSDRQIEFGGMRPRVPITKGRMEEASCDGYAGSFVGANCLVAAQLCFFGSLASKNVSKFQARGVLLFYSKTCRCCGDWFHHDMPSGQDIQRDIAMKNDL